MGKDEGEGGSDDAASIKIAPPPYPSAPNTLLCSSPLQSLHIFIISLLNHKSCRYTKGELRCYYPPTHILCFMETYADAEGEYGYKKGKGCACLLTNCFSLPSGQTPNASSCFLSTCCRRLKFKHLVCL